jgi:N-acetylmuramoyl-L-alanine amidase
MSAQEMQRATIGAGRGRWVLGLTVALIVVASWRRLNAPGVGFVLVTRQQWDRDRVLLNAVPEQTIRRIVIHHDGVDYRGGSSGEEKATALLRAARGNEGWPDVPYHYLIDRDGRVFAGLPEHLRGDTHGLYDPSDSLHIALMGNYSNLEPTEAQLTALRALVREKARQYRLSADAIKMHGQIARTECPGTHLRERLASMRW